MPRRAHLVFLRSGLVLSKHPYAHWRSIQDAFPDYSTSLGPWTEAEVAAYFALDYTDDDARWPFSRAEITAFFASDDETLQRNLSGPRT